MQVEKIELTIAPGFIENSYIVSDSPQATHVIVVDPGAQAKRVLEAVGERVVDAIVLTHRHYDHMGAAATLAKKCGGCAVIAHRLDAEAVADPSQTGSFIYNLVCKPVKVTRIVDEGDSIPVGSAKLTVLHTPGHSIGSMCLYDETEPLLIAGDTIFYGAAGRTDLPTGDAKQQQASLKRLATLPDETKVYCGHDADTTIGREKRYGYLAMFR